MISHPLSRSSIVDQGPVCRARGGTRRTSARHFPRVGHRPPVHGFMPCRLHAAALFCASKASTVAPAIRARDFVKRPLARQIKRHQGKIAPSIILRGGTLLQRRGQARRSAQNVHRLGSSWAHTASIHRLRVLMGGGSVRQASGRAAAWRSRDRRSPARWYERPGPRRRTRGIPTCPASK